MRLSRGRSQLAATNLLAVAEHPTCEPSDSHVHVVGCQQAAEPRRGGERATPERPRRNATDDPGPTDKQAWRGSPGAARQPLLAGTGPSPPWWRRIGSIMRRSSTVHAVTGSFIGRSLHPRRQRSHRRERQDVERPRRPGVPRLPSQDPKGPLVPRDPADRPSTTLDDSSTAGITVSFEYTPWLGRQARDTRAAGTASLAPCLHGLPPLRRGTHFLNARTSRSRRQCEHAASRSTTSRRSARRRPTARRLGSATGPLARDRLCAAGRCRCRGGHRCRTGRFQQPALVDAGRGPARGGRRLPGPAPSAPPPTPIASLAGGRACGGGCGRSSWPDTSRAAVEYPRAGTELHWPRR
jgi:hypothetical protein